MTHGWRFVIAGFTPTTCQFFAQETNPPSQTLSQKHTGENDCDISPPAPNCTVHSWTGKECSEKQNKCKKHTNVKKEKKILKKEGRKKKEKKTIDKANSDLTMAEVYY